MQYQNNPLASPWMWGGSYCAPEGKQDTFFMYVLERALTAGQILPEQPFLFDGDGCFVWRCSASAAGGSSSPYFAWRDSLGRQLSNQLLRVPGYCGGAGQHSAVVPVQIIEPGARWTYNVTDSTSVGAGTVHFAMIGVKRS